MQGLVRAAEASGRGDTEVCLSRTSAYTQSVRDEVHWHLLHWKADICCYSLEGVRWGMRGSVDGITSKPMVAACEAVLPYYLNWNAGFCCYSLRRGPLGHDAERCGDGCRRRR